MREASVLVLLNPGRQSRWYLLGLARAGERLGMKVAGLELKGLWDRVQGATDKAGAIRGIGGELRRVCERERLTHVIGYGYNGVELGQVFGPGVEPLFASLGMQHLMLWTDHPNWMMHGSALEPAMREVLGHRRHVHFLKSEIAAAEARGVLGWAHVFGLAMAEDYELVRPGGGGRRTHDVVAIVGSAGVIAPELVRFLEEDDPDAAEIDGVMAPKALAALRGAMVGQPGWAGAADEVMDWGERVLAARRGRALDAVWRLAGEPGLVAPGWLMADGRRWFGAGAGLRVATQWRREFWLAWLGRRRRVLVCGCDARGLTPDQPEGARGWVEYERQGEVYGLGGCAVNVNAGHDEEGCTHKPFQIAAAGAGCVHHRTRGLEALFEEPGEIRTFATGPELLAGVDEAGGGRGELGGAMLARAKREHTWERRLMRMLELAERVRG